MSHVCLTKTISDAVSRMMVGSHGRFKKAIEKDCNINVDVSLILM